MAKRKSKITVVRNTSSKKKTNNKKSKEVSKKQNKRWLLRLFFRLLLWGFIALLLFIAYCYITLPDVSKAVENTRRPSVTIIAENGNDIFSYGKVYSEVVDVKDLPVFVSKAIIATEDRRFYSHFGFDPIGFSRAMLTNLIKMRYAQGGSTITQQVAKNLFLTSKKTIKRKVQELLLAFWLESHFNKDQILTLYLNRVYLGKGTYGIEAAANRYFGKSSRDLTLIQSAVLAGMLKAPSRYNPSVNEERSRDRAKVVLRNMQAIGFLTEKEVEFAAKQPILPKKLYRVKGGRYFSDYVFNLVPDYIGEYDDDILIYTTLSQDLQEKSEKVLKEVINANKDKNVSQGAIIILNRDGEIKAMVGGVDYNSSQFNRATQALRQAGSAFKPFVYLTALQYGFRPYDKILDEQFSIKGWMPKNYNDKYFGEVTLDFALSKSLNTVAARLGEIVDRKEVIKNAKRLGITTKIDNLPSIALGTALVKPIDMATAYASFANNGYVVWPHAISEVYTKNGIQLYSRISDEGNRIIGEDVVKDMNFMLNNVVKNGTGRRARIAGTQVFGKTGTSQDYRDAWFIGYTEDYIAAIWLGNDDNSPMEHVSGGNLPATIFNKILSD